MRESDRTAYIFLPGGLGTLDEFFVSEGRVGATPCLWEEARGHRLSALPVLCHCSSPSWLLVCRTLCRGSALMQPPVARHPGAPPPCRAPLQEILTLVQLRKLGTKFPVPVILVDWDGFYAGLLQVRLLSSGWLAEALVVDHLYICGGALAWRLSR